ncbi:hypothetical protein ABEB36_003513 [Hypothenemus hampei]|uniref:PLAT domain-containing protein n=1 Tax=Hypothenemus hampei TaxID=57062 RepID=A0ABD1F9E0_HYPHA
MSDLKIVTVSYRTMTKSYFIAVICAYFTFLSVHFSDVNSECVLKPVENIDCYDNDMYLITNESVVKFSDRITIVITTEPDGCVGARNFIMLHIPPSDGIYKKEGAKGQELLSITSNEVYIAPYVLKHLGPVITRLYRYDDTTKNVIGDGKECKFTVVLSDPIATLIGGSEYRYPAETESIVKCHAENPNVQNKSMVNLDFKWECSIQKGNDYGFCNSNVMNKAANKTTITIPTEAAQVENIYLIKVTVSLRNHSENATIVTQKISFHKKTSVTLGIQCIKNCAPLSKVTLTSEPVILKAVGRNWSPSEDNLNWTVTDSENNEINYSTLKSKTGSQFYLKPEPLKEDQLYLVRCQVIGGEHDGLSAEITLDTNLPPVPKCNVNPTEGIAFQTPFRIECLSIFHKVYYEGFALKHPRETLLFETRNLEEETFMLPADSKLKLNVIYVDFDLTTEITLDVKVAKCMNLTGKSDKEINQIVNDKLQEALEYSQSGHDEFALQGIGAIVSEYSDTVSDKIIVAELDNTVISALEEINLNNPKSAQQVVDIISQIIPRYEKADPDISEKSTDICWDARTVLDNQVENEENTQFMKDQIKHTMKSMASCSQAGLNANFDSVKTENVTVSLPTTGAPLMTIPGLKENYPDYNDDEHSTDNMAKFEKASNNMKNICFSNAKMMSPTMVPEEDPIKVTQDSLTIITGRMYCTEVNSRKISDENNIKFWVQPSIECKNRHTPIIDVLLCSTLKNPYWYIDNITLITPVVYAKFIGLKKKSSFMIDLVERASVRFKLSLPAIDVIAPQKLTIHEAELPAKSISSLDEEDFYETISIHRIFVAKYQGFTVHFELIDNLDSYEVTVTDFEKPTYNFFKSNSRKMNISNKIIDITTIKDYDSFWFLSLLPSDEMKNQKSNYSFTVSTTGCYSWNDTSKYWEPACFALAGRVISPDITCFCQYGTTFTGFVKDIKVNLEESIPIDFYIEFQFFWVIYVTTLVTFLIFLVVLFLVEFEQPIDILDMVFFLGDVPSFCQYAYILKVKTGKKRRSGTTANITIQLYGSQGNSLPHVLNFPDPELVMLRKNTEIWFVFATSNALGNLKNIEIWFDSLGHDTRWYCSYVEVFDIQLEKTWMFEVERWFDIEIPEGSKVSVVPTQKQEIKKTTTQIKIGNAIKRVLGKTANEIHLWNLWSSDLLLSRKERTCLIFFFIISMYVVIMLLFSIPRFNESDVIDLNTFGFDTTLIWTPIVGNFIAMLLNFPLVFTMKRHRIKTLTIKKKPIDVINISWNITTAITTIFLSVLIICGFWIPWDTSLLWLVSVILGVCLNILVVQNLFRFFYGCYIRVPEYMLDSMNKTSKVILDYVELQRTWIYKRFGSMGLRPYLQHLYTPLDVITARDRYKWEETKAALKEILEDLAMITVYVSLLYIVLLFDRDNQSYYNHEEIKNLVLGRMVPKEITLDSIENVESFISEVLLPSVQSVQWYKEYAEDYPGMSKDFSNKYLGVIRLRQHRTKEVPCKLPKVMSYLNITCRPDFNVLKEKGDFSRGWQPATDKSYITTERMASVWKYTDSKYTGSPSHFGEYATYPGGGYVASLGRHLKNSLINMKYLKKHKWLDLRTRALFIEFLSYNPNVNLFNGVTLIFEANSAGDIFRNFQIHTRKLLMIDQKQIYTKNLVSNGFLLIIVILMIRVVYKLKKKKKEYFRDIWSILDIFILILSISSIYLYYARLQTIHSYVTAIIEAKNNEFVNYFDLFTADNTLATLSATLVFVATLRLWKLLRVMVIVKTAEKTINDAGSSLLLCLIYQMMLVVVFSIAGVLLFGNGAEDFKSFRISFPTLLLLSLNLNSDFDLNILYRHPMGIPFYITYMLVSFFFINLYIAIINLHYADTKNFYDDTPNLIEKYLNEKWIYYKSLLTIKAKKLRGGADDLIENELVIKPKPGERYENCFTIAKSRLNAMALVSMCVLRNLEQHRTMTSKDIDLMSKTVPAYFSMKI